MNSYTERYSAFLTNYEFYSNSIDFRIQSSKALEKWKNIQSFQLNQLVHGKYHFTPKRRELLLLSYDMGSRWLYETENLFIELLKSDERPSNSEVLQLVTDLFMKTVTKFSSIVLSEHTDYFDQPFSKIWLEQHEAVRLVLCGRLSSIGIDNMANTYSKIVDIMAEMMQYVLVETYELCNLCDGNDPFIVVSKQCEEHPDDYINLIISRVRNHKKHFNITTIYIKNYTDQHISKTLIKLLEEEEIIIDFKKSFLNS